MNKQELKGKEDNKTIHQGKEHRNHEDFSS